MLREGDRLPVGQPSLPGMSEATPEELRYEREMTLRERELALRERELEFRRVVEQRSTVQTWLAFVLAALAVGISCVSLMVIVVRLGM